MKLTFIAILTLASISVLGFQEQTTPSKPSPNRGLIIDANKLIKEYHSGISPANNVVKVIYFHGNDQDPLNNWKERLTRSLDDVSDFYREEFARSGVDIKGVPFEKANGQYVFHLVKGNSVSKYYTIQSGPIIIKEIVSKNSGIINPSKDYVLVINGLCDKRNDGTYVFHSPYFGMSSGNSGICLVADCELLDSKFLNDKTQRMAFSEMMIKYKECTVAEFNSWYVGGIAHEMAHIFGLPHDFGSPMELDNHTISLMGQYGSRHFRDYLWNGEKSAIFSSASIIQLISHPVFTNSNKNRTLRPNTLLSNLIFDRTDSGIILRAQLKTDINPYAVIALIHPAQLTEYFNQSYSSLVSKSDTISLKLGILAKGDYNLQLLFVYLNGANIRFNRVITVDNDKLVKVKI